jgi:hypothetical protein
MALADGAEDRISRHAQRRAFLEPDAELGGGAQGQRLSGGPGALATSDAEVGDLAALHHQIVGSQSNGFAHPKARIRHDQQ